MKGGIILAVTTADSKQAYLSLYSVLERNDIDYELTKSRSVRCSVSGRDRDIQLYFSIDASKMLVTLYSTICRRVPQQRTTDAALALCMINNTLTDGELCFDINDRLIYFKMTSSFYNAGLNSSVYEYMLSVAADTIDSYRTALERLMKTEPGPVA